MKAQRIAEGPPVYRGKKLQEVVRKYLAESRETGDPSSVAALVSGVRRGLPYAEFEALREQLDVTAEEMAAYLGIPRAKLEELITHVAHYAGWPAAVSAFRVLDEVWQAMDAEPPAQPGAQ